MTHYQKLTTVICNTIGMLALLYGAIGTVLSGLLILIHEIDTPHISATLQITQGFYYFTSLIFGAVVLLVAKFLVKDICKNLESYEKLKSDGE